MGNPITIIQTLITIVQALGVVIPKIIECVNMCEEMGSLKTAVDSLNEISVELSENEKKALEIVSTTKELIEKALHKGRIAIARANAVIFSFRNTLNESEKWQPEQFGERAAAAVTKYKSRILSLIESCKEAHETMFAALCSMKKAKINITILKSFCERNIMKYKGQRKYEVDGERRKAYGGAAGATGSVALFVGIIVAATNFWNPAGWIAFGGVVGGTALTSFAVATGVAEGITVKEIENFYNNIISAIELSKTKFKFWEEDADKNIDLISKKTTQMITIHANLEVILENEEDYLCDLDETYFHNIKASVQNLQKHLDKYIQEDNKEEEK